MNNVTINELYDLSHTVAGEYLSKFTYPWEALKGISDFIIELGKTLSRDEYDNPFKNVWIHKTANIYPTAYIGEPCIICANTEVRHLWSKIVEILNSAIYGGQSKKFA